MRYVTLYNFVLVSKGFSAIVGKKMISMTVIKKISLECVLNIAEMYGLCRSLGLNCFDHAKDKRRSVK